ncbi:MAG: hypothetical protein O2894_12130, partial [Planctomycetota bacterium]|nr:hypothetical protein [Planctomycetota bacterium]
ARSGGPGPQAPIWPPAGKTDRMLYEKACTLQAQMWSHISPEGLLIVRHPRGADGAALSREALFRSDACMWTGCYAAAQACRWYVTHDPDALEQVRFLARGMAALSTVTGTKGAFARNLGRPTTPGEGEDVTRSTAMDGYWFRADVSRDQLAGLTMGWAFIGRFMEDEALRRLAGDQIRDIALRLVQDKMWLRDHRGNKTEYGELRTDIPFVPFIRNGALAAIGLAPLVAAADLNPADDYVGRALRDLDRGGWDEAQASQNTQLPMVVNSSNVNMVTVALLVNAISSQRDGRPAHYAKRGMAELRGATVGWWNAGTCACFLLGDMPGDKRTLRGEIRATLHGMPAQEEPRALVREWRQNRAAPIWMRQVSSWHWTNDVSHFHEWKPATELPDTVYWTGADWLFAYWVARAAQELIPIVGAGASPREHHIEAVRPPWTR